MKLVISEKTGKSYQTEIPKDKESAIIGHKIGETIDAGQFGAEGYTLKITGGSDLGGFPMRGDVAGPRRVEVLLSDAPGFRAKQKGERAKRSVRGNVISDQIFQVNAQVVEAGTKPLAEIFPPSKKEDKKK
jgi:small subunit ribosomal protein S6e